MSADPTSSVSSERSGSFHSLADRLSDALDAFDWEETEGVCRQIVGQIADPLPAGSDVAAARMLHDLRRKRQFLWLERLAEAWLLGGLRRPRVRRQFAQALIDQRRVAAAEHV